MFRINFKKEEILYMRAVYKVLSRKISWDILEKLQEYDRGLTQSDFKNKLPIRKAFSSVLNDLLDLGLITKESVNLTNPMSREIIYYLNDKVLYDLDEDLNSIELKKHFSIEQVKKVLERNKEKQYSYIK